MKVSKTTLAGTLSAAFFAAALAPRVHDQLSLIFSVGGCVCLALLGVCSSDCPANCPGTDAQGRKNKQLRPTGILSILTLAGIVTAWLLSGCTAPNPAAGPSHPGEPAYIVAPSLLAASNTATGVTQIVSPLVPGGSALPLAVNGLFGLLGALSLWYAQHKSATTAAIAAGVAGQTPAVVSAVIASAADSPKFAAVATAINAALPEGQAPGQGPTKPL